MFMIEPKQRVSSVDAPGLRSSGVRVRLSSKNGSVLYEKAFEHWTDLRVPAEVCAHIRN